MSMNARVEMEDDGGMGPSIARQFLHVTRLNEDGIEWDGQYSNKYLQHSDRLCSSAVRNTQDYYNTVCVSIHLIEHNSMADLSNLHDIRVMSFLRRQSSSCPLPTISHL